VQGSGPVPKIGGLIQSFIEEVLFEQAVSLYDARLAGRLGDPDVATHVLHVFALSCAIGPLPQRSARPSCHQHP
jgi:hypothetical protein